jgi:hypothetical protein
MFLVVATSGPAKATITRTTLARGGPLIFQKLRAGWSPIVKELP